MINTDKNSSTDKVYNIDKKCPGCGVEIQTLYEDKAGYIKEEVLKQRGDNFLCERCYRLKHYNEINKKDISIDFDKVFGEISKEKNLIVNVIDAFDLLGSTIKDINNMFPKSKVLVIANKYDLFMRSNRPTKLRRYLKEYLSFNNIDYCDVIVTSSLTNDSAFPIYNALCEHAKINNKKNLNVYFVGITNVGKSTLLNTLSSLTKNPLSLTTSNQVGTTQDITRYKLGDLNVGDTPGYYNKGQATYYLDKKSLNNVIPKKFIKPRVYQLYNNDTIFINGFGYFTYISESDDKLGVTIYVANTLMLYRTKNDPREYYQKHKDDLLLVPNKKEREKLGEMYEREIDVNAKEELVLSGVGFISFNKKAKIIINTLDNIDIEIRNAMI